MAFLKLSSEQIQSYHEDGYVIARRMFDNEDIGMLKSIAKNGPVFTDNWERKDASGKPIRLKLWNHPPDNIYGAFARCERMLNSAERTWSVWNRPESTTNWCPWNWRPAMRFCSTATCFTPRPQTSPTRHAGH